MATKIGITGGIGSGKSVVARLLETMGVPVYISDVEAKRLTQSDQRIRQELTALVGDEVYLPDGQLNRLLLAKYLFGDQARAGAVNAIIHPQVKEDFRRWAGQRPDGSRDLVAMESAILIESGFRDEVDLLVTVYAPLDLRIRRATSRDGASREQVLARVEAQMDDDEKRALADFVIQNDGKAALIPQVLRLISFASGNNDYLCSAKNK
ncbi:MAG: dephospho-CoA kinase [Mediterranea sp.]|jgi:dephospho-CoA kinase|nr:dephospho-CoA kinase [Mediterranea sp.]